MRSRVLLLLVTLALCFAIAEIAARLWIYSIADDYVLAQVALYEKIPPRQRMFQPHHYLNYCNTPNYVSRDGLNKHNSLGYRGDEIEMPKPKGRFRIVALGGSSTYTIKVGDYKKTFTALLEKQLTEKYGYENIEVINAGVGGYNSWESLINLQTRLLDLEPDMVIVYHGVNDVHARVVLPGAYRGDNSGQRKQWSRPPIGLWQRSALLRYVNYKIGLLPSRHIGLEGYVNTDTSYMYMWSRSPQMVDVVDKNPPTYFQRNLENMIAVARVHGVRIVLATWAHSPLKGDYVTWPHYQKGIAQNNDVVKQVAMQNNVPMFDFAAAMPQDKQYWHDGRHVNQAGSQKKAELFAAFLNKIKLTTHD